MNTTVVNQQKNPGCLVQIVWFLVIGWWLGQAWIIVAWLLMLTVIFIPISVKMLNNLPKIIALRGQSSDLIISTADGKVFVRSGAQRPQVNLLVRIVYFFVIGWWLSAIWMELAYAVCATVIGLPIGFWMFDRVPAILSLKQ